MNDEALSPSAFTVSAYFPSCGTSEAAAGIGAVNTKLRSGGALLLISMDNELADQGGLMGKQNKKVVFMGEMWYSL